MPKGFFSQGVCLLTDGRTAISDVRSAVEKAAFHIHKEVAANDLWSFSGPAVVIPYRAAVNGGVTIDVVNHPWPDAMGDPKSDPMTFGAWGWGYFGPFTYPGSLGRALQHASGWEAGRNVAPLHRGFIRIRSSYVGGAAADAPCLPEDYDALDEMGFISRLVITLGTVPGVLCYFNPNGEVLWDMSSFASTWDDATKQQKVPLLLWMNVRLFHVDRVFGFMDTVGNAQLDVRDIEVIYPVKRYDPGIIDYYMGNVTHYLLDLGREIQTGEAIDGPGENALSWTAVACDQGIMSPPRPVLRLYPKADAAPIQKALAAATSSAG